MFFVFLLLIINSFLLHCFSDGAGKLWKVNLRAKEEEDLMAGMTSSL